MQSNTTTKATETKLNLTLGQGSKSAPVAYSDAVWDVAETDSNLASMMGGAGQYSQHEINARLAEGGQGVGSVLVVEDGMLCMTFNVEE